MFSGENNMDPGIPPAELQNLTVIEQQLIAKISPCINIHMLKHVDIAANGHCVSIPHEINEPAKILPLLPSAIKIIQVGRKGENYTSKDCLVRRSKVENALTWLKHNNKVLSDITISQERLNLLLEDGQLPNINTIGIGETLITTRVQFLNNLL